LDHFEVLFQKFREIGSIKSAVVISEKMPDEEVYSKIEKFGYQIKIVPLGTADISFLLEAYDKVLFEGLDIAIFVTNDENLLPLFTESKSKVDEIFLLTTTDPSEVLINTFDSIMSPESLMSYSYQNDGITFDFNGKPLDELSIEEDQFDIDDYALNPRDIEEEE
jgi:hypothetical protein